LELQKVFTDILSFSSASGLTVTVDALADFRVSKFAATHPQDGVDTAAFYRVYVQEQLSFHFDPLGTNRIDAVQVITSPSFTQVIELDGRDTVNPYSFVCFRKWLNTFTAAADRGMLTRRGFKGCRAKWVFSDAFIDRVFDAATLYNDRLDLRGYFRFVVAFENRDTDAGARYFFGLIDVDGDGVLGHEDIAFFFKDLVRESGTARITFEWFMQEILDEVQSRSPAGFTLPDFTQSGACRDITCLLANYLEFRKSMPL
jgi:hypothetical protein